MKNDRQRRILEIVEREAIDTQEQLQQRLQEQGHGFPRKIPLPRPYPS